MKIPLTFGQTAFVDQKDYERCIKGPQWYALASRRRDGSIRTYYAVRNILTPEGSITSQLMHRFILRLSDIKIHTDHKNGNGLDNRRKNISKVNNLQNSQNRVRLDSRSTSGVMGVYWDKTNNKWVAEIISYGKYKFLGRFSALKDAKSARKRAEAERGQVKTPQKYRYFPSTWDSIAVEKHFVAKSGHRPNYIAIEGLLSRWDIDQITAAIDQLTTATEPIGCDTLLEKVELLLEGN